MRTEDKEFIHFQLEMMTRSCVMVRQRCQLFIPAIDNLCQDYLTAHQFTLLDSRRENLEAEIVN